MRKDKTVDCVDVQHRGGMELARRLAAMTEEEQTTFWREREKEIRERQAARRRAAETA